MDLHLSHAKPRIEQLCALHHVLRLEVFGSAVSAPPSHPPNDYDFIVELADSQGASKARRWIAFAQALEDTLGKPVDLISLAAVRNPYMAQQIQANSIPLYEQPDPSGLTATA
jgi:predicted nucleotidyltransferase